MNSRTPHETKPVSPDEPFTRASQTTRGPSRPATVDSELEFVKLQFELLLSVVDAESAMTANDFLKILKRSLREARIGPNSAAKFSLKAALGQRLGNLPQSPISQKLDLMSKTLLDFAAEPVVGLGNVLSVLFENPDELLDSKVLVLKLLRTLSLSIVAMADKSAHDVRKRLSLSARLEHLERKLLCSGHSGEKQLGHSNGQALRRAVPSAESVSEEPPSGRSPPYESMLGAEMDFLHKRNHLDCFEAPFSRDTAADRSKLRGDSLLRYNPSVFDFFSHDKFAGGELSNHFFKNWKAKTQPKTKKKIGRANQNSNSTKKLLTTPPSRLPAEKPGPISRSFWNPTADSPALGLYPVDEQYKPTKKVSKRTWTSSKGIFCWSGATNLKRVARDFAMCVSKSIGVLAAVGQPVVSRLSIKAFTKAKKRPNMLIVKVKFHPKYRDLIECDWARGSPSEFFRFKVDLVKDHRIRLWNQFAQADEHREVPYFGKSRNRYSSSQANYIYESEHLNADYVNAEIARALKPRSE